MFKGRTLSIALRPPGSATQWGFLVRSVGPIAVRQSPFTGGFTAIPILYDFDNHCVANQIVHDVVTESMEQGDSCFRDLSLVDALVKDAYGLYNTETLDTNFKHSYVSGSLRPFTGVSARSFEEFFESDGVTTYADGSFYVGSSDPRPNALEHGVPIYTVGGRDFQCYGPNYAGMNFSWVRKGPKDSSDVEPVLSVERASRGHYRGVTYGDGKPLLIQDVTAEIPDSFEFTNGSLALKERSIYSYDGEVIYDEVGDMMYTFYPWEPVMNGDVFNQHSLTSIQWELRRIADSMISTTWSITPQDGAFLATQQAVEAFRLAKVSGLEFVSDLRDIISLVLPIIELIRKPLVVKNWAQAVLWFKYGIKPTISDILTICQGIKRLKALSKNLTEYSVLRRSLQTRYGTFIEPSDVISDDGFISMSGKHRSNVRVCARPVLPGWLNSFLLVLNDLGFRLSAGNIWDCIPYSFMVDWFMNIGGLLSQFDMDCELDQLNVRENLRSVKNSLTSEEWWPYSESFPVIGALDCVCYDRGIYKYLSDPPYTLGSTSPFLRHWWEGVCIYLSSRR